MKNMKGGSPAYDRVNALYSNDCLQNHTNSVDFSQYNTSPKATLNNTYNVSYQTSVGKTPKIRKNKRHSKK